MRASDVSLEVIEDFLLQRRIAVVGVSRQGRDISMHLVSELQRRGYEIFLVNPKANEIAGQRCYVRVQDIQPPPDGALVLTNPSLTGSVVRDCADAGIRRVWMFRGGGQGAVSSEAVEFCRAMDIKGIPGQCPFMFLDPVRNIHWLHRCFAKLARKYPQRAKFISA
jgi:predicted CoA-binding protein